MTKSFDHAALLFPWLIVGSTCCSDVKNWAGAYWQVVKVCGVRKSQCAVAVYSAADTTPLYTHSGMATRSSNKRDLIKMLLGRANRGSGPVWGAEPCLPSLKVQLFQGWAG